MSYWSHFLSNCGRKPLTILSEDAYIQTIKKHQRLLSDVFDEAEERLGEKADIEWGKKE
jgi:hypothetical protein